MKCPKCGRYVRSTTRCAHCGHVFNSDSKPKEHGQANKKPKQPVAPAETQGQKTPPKKKEKKAQKSKPSPSPKKRGAGRKFVRGIWSFVKVILLVVIIFLLFLFGPNIISEVKDFINSDKGQVSQEVSVENASEADSQTSEENASGLTMIDSKVDLNEYPRVNVTMTFNEDLNDVNRDTFKFALKTDGESTPIEDEYALIKDGTELNITYSDPTDQILAGEAQEQVLEVSSEELGFKDEVQYTLPLVSVDQAQFDALNDLINEELGQLGTVSAVISDVQDEVPFTYDNHSVEAGNTISWFVLARIFEAVDEGSISLEDEVEIKESLKSPEEETATFYTPEGESLTVQTLVESVINNQDISAMNHLIQTVGGPNEFNLWLNESGYFATRLTQLPEYTASGKVEGVVTSAQDIALLLQQLSQNELISEEADATFKEYLLDSPVTRKYPEEGIEEVTRRYEISTSDENESLQYYTGILEMEETEYVIVLLVSDFEDSEEVVTTISQVIQDTVNFLNTGDVTETSDASEETSEDESEESSDEESSRRSSRRRGTDDIVPNEDGYAVQTVENTGEEAWLPVITDPDTGEPIPVTWTYDEETGRYNYKE